MGSTPDAPLNLAVAIHRGVPGALERLLDTYESALFAYADAMLQNAFDAQEVVQDAVLRAHKALTRRYDEARCAALLLEPWLFRTVRNLALNKRRSKRFRVEQALGDEHDRAESPSSSDFERQQERERLQLALDQLPPEARELVALRFLDELSYADIAAVTGMTEAALRGKVFRALKHLRALLEGQQTASASDGSKREMTTPRAREQATEQTRRTR